MTQRINELKYLIEKKKKEKETSEKNIEIEKTNLNHLNRTLYELELEYLHTTRIYDLASHHFPRLRGDQSNNLTEKDHEELEKWIGRAKSVDSLQDIVNALTELSKYFPKDIKSNLYGLVQKIIIEGAYRVKKGEKNGKG